MTAYLNGKQAGRGKYYGAPNCWCCVQDWAYHHTRRFKQMWKKIYKRQTRRSIQKVSND